MSALPEQHTYLPEHESAEALATVHSFLQAHQEARGHDPDPRYLLVGADEGDQVELPAEVHRALVQVVEALRSGRAVTVAPQSTTLTTQQAADLLGVSRPTVVRFIDEGRLAAERPGVHRRVKLSDLMSFRERRREEQYAALFADSSELDDDSVQQSLERARQARRDVGQRRRRDTEPAER